MDQHFVFFILLTRKTSKKTYLCHFSSSSSSGVVVYSSSSSFLCQVDEENKTEKKICQLFHDRCLDLNEMEN
jgi:hypothetical protein